MTNDLRNRPPMPQGTQGRQPEATNADVPDTEYEHGYCRPPKHSQFKKGQSGNPKGRKKGSKNIATIAKEVLFKQVTVHVDGRRRKIPAFEALMLNLLKLSLENDMRAFDKMMKVLPMVQASMAAEDATENGKAVDPRHDAETLAEFAKMLREADIAKGERSNND